MHYQYFPGCSLKSTGRPYEESLLAVLRALEVPVREIEDWNCCGATAYMAIDEVQAFALAGRNLAIAERQPEDLMAPCSACYLVLNKTQRYMQEYPQIRERLEKGFKAAG